MVTKTERLTKMKKKKKYSIRSAPHCHYAFWLQKITIAEHRQADCLDAREEKKILHNRRRQSFSVIFLIPFSEPCITRSLLEHTFYACTRVHCTFGSSFCSMVIFMLSKKKNSINSNRAILPVRVGRFMNFVGCHSHLHRTTQEIIVISVLRIPFQYFIFQFFSLERQRTNCC